MRRRRMAVLMLVLAVVVAGLVGLAWMIVFRAPNADGKVLRPFSLVVNGDSRGNVKLLVPLNGTFSNDQAVRVSEEVFMTVMGWEVVRRLDGLSVEDNLMHAHYTWGVNESDMGHVYDMTLNATTLTIDVAHCR